MNTARITPRQVGDALVLTLPGEVSTAGPAKLAQSLLGAVGGASPPLIVLDLRAMDLLPVRTARGLMEFARGSAARGSHCVLLPDPASTAAVLVLDAVDPGGTVPRFVTLEQALAGHASAEPTPPEAAPDAVAFDSTDVDRIEEFLSNSYAPMRIIGATGPADAHISRVGAGAVRVDQVELSFDLVYQVEPLGVVCLCDVEAGTLSGHVVDGWREPVAYGPGDLFTVPPDRSSTGRAHRIRQVVVLLDPTVLGQVAGADRQITLLDHRPHDATHLRAAMAHLRDEVLAASDVVDNPLVVSAASHYLAAAVLNAFPNDALTVPAHVDRNDAHFHTLRRAIAFIEANAGRDISAADIAAAAYVTTRAVQLAFRRHLGMAPMAYLRRVRLDCARAELLAADPSDTTVTQIGTRWGYGRASTFAAHYRAAYGEPPSQTLRLD